MLQNDDDHNSVKWISPHCTLIIFLYIVAAMACSLKLDHLFCDIRYANSMLKTVC